MDPWDWHPPTSPTRPQRKAVSGGPFDVSDVNFPGLYTSRPLWDLVVSVLSLGGLAST